MSQSCGSPAHTSEPFWRKTPMVSYESIITGQGQVKSNIAAPRSLLSSVGVSHCVIPSQIFELCRSNNIILCMMSMLSCTHHRGLVIAMEDVDEIRNSQHTCERNRIYAPTIIIHSDQDCAINPSSYPQISVTCCPTKAQPSSRLPPVQKRPFSPVEA